MCFGMYDTMPNQPADLAAFARDHHGLFRRQDAVALGWTDARLQQLVCTGWCDKPRHGVYRIGGAPRTLAQTDLAAVWFAGADGVASHRAASRLWGAPGFGNAGPEITRPRGRSQRREYGSVHGSLVLPGSHRTEHRSIPITTPARTVFDLAGVVSPGRTERVLDDFLNRRLCTLAQLQQVFFALARRGRRGTVTMRTLLEARGEGYIATASELERRARAVFEQHGLPMPEFEVDLGSEAWVGRVDCYWRDQRVVVELDSRLHHTALVDREADRRRDNELMAAGWRVIRVTWRDLHDDPAKVCRLIRTALAAAA